MSTSPKLIKVLLAGDDSLFPKGFKSLTPKKKHTTFEVIGKAANGKELLKMAEALTPDVVITDIPLPGMGGMEATIQLKKRYPTLAVIVFSSFTSPQLVCDMLEAGVSGYLLKDAKKVEIELAIATIFTGGTYLCNDADVQAGNEKFTNRNSIIKRPFTSREREITRLISKEYSNTEIAGLLGLSVRSIETYRERIIEKVGAKNSIGVINYAFKNKLLK